jgi:hypothetical protein
LGTLDRACEDFLHGDELVYTDTAAAH